MTHEQMLRTLASIVESATKAQSASIKPGSGDADVDSSELEELIADMEVDIELLNQYVTELRSR